MRNMFRRFVNAFLILVISLNSIAPLPLAIAQDAEPAVSSEPALDVTIVMVNPDSAAPAPAADASAAPAAPAADAAMAPAADASAAPAADASAAPAADASAAPAVDAATAPAADAATAPAADAAPAPVVDAAPAPVVDAAPAPAADAAPAPAADAAPAPVADVATAPAADASAVPAADAATAPAADASAAPAANAATAPAADASAAPVADAATAPAADASAVPAGDAALTAGTDTAQAAADTASAHAADTTPAEGAPAGDAPAADAPAADTPANDTPAADTPASETAADKASTGDTSAADTPADNTSADDSAADTAANDTQAVYTYVPNTPTNETPASDTAVSDEPIADIQVPEAEVSETPADETPAADDSAADTTTDETPASDKSDAETPADETPASDGSAAETPADETPASDGSAAETPADEVPASDGPVSEEESTEAPLLGAAPTDENTDGSDADPAAETPEPTAEEPTDPEGETDDTEDTAQEQDPYTLDCYGEVCYEFGDPEKTVYLDREDLPEIWNVSVGPDGIFHFTFTIEEDAEAEVITIDLNKVMDQIVRINSYTLQPGDSMVFDATIRTKSGHTYKYIDGSFVLTTPDMLEDDMPDDPVTGFDDQELDNTHTRNHPDINVVYKIDPILALLRSDSNPYYDADLESDITYNRRFGSYVYSWLYGELNSIYEADHEGESPADRSAAVEYYILKYYNEKEQPETPYTSYTDLFDRSEDAYNNVFIASATLPAWVELTNARIPYPSNMDYNRFFETVFRVVYGEGKIYNEDGTITTIDQTDVTDATGEFRYQEITPSTVYDVYDYDDDPPTLYTGLLPANELGYGSLMRRYGLPEDTLMMITAQGGIIAGLSTADGEIATASNSQEFKKEVVSVYSAWENSRWHDSENQVISDSVVSAFMDLLSEEDKRSMDKNSEVWQRANNFFNELLGQGISANDAAAASFMMAFNIDGQLAGNSYQDSFWGHKNEIKLERIDGQVEINKSGEITTQYYDEDGNVIEERTETESVPTITGGETTFQLWYYKENDGQQEKYFMTQTKETDPETGEEKINQGFVKYDPEKSEMNYTIDTTGGKLQIDYAMLEGQVYYLQETVAPDDYELDTKVYIICDSEEGVDAAKAALKLDEDVKEADIENAAYAGKVDSEAKLDINIVNVKTVTVTPEPTTVTPEPTTVTPEPTTVTPEPTTVTPEPTTVTPEPTTVTPEPPTVTPEPPDPTEEPTPEPPDPYVPYTPPTVPDTPEEETTIDEYDVPLAGLITMNEGDCFN